MKEDRKKKKEASKKQTRKKKKKEKKGERSKKEKQENTKKKEKRRNNVYSFLFCPCHSYFYSIFNYFDLLQIQMYTGKWQRGSTPRSSCSAGICSPSGGTRMGNHAEATVHALLF